MKRFVLFLLVVGVLRGLAVPFVTDADNPGPDGHDYLRVAGDFLSESFPWRKALDQTSWAPGWPAFMACLFRIFGTSWTAVRVANVILWVATLGLGYSMTRRAFGATVALLATTLVAWDNLTAFIKYLNYEVYLTFLTTATLAALQRGAFQACGGWFAAAGVLAGLACLVQSKMVALLGVAGLAAAMGSRSVAGESDSPTVDGKPPTPLAVDAGVRVESVSVRRRLVHLLCFSAGMGLALVPYSYRNWVAIGRFSFVASVGPINLVIGNGPQANGLWTWIPGAWQSRIDRAPESERSAVAREIVKADLTRNPVRWLFQTLPRKFHHLWGLDTVRHHLFLVAMCVGMVLHCARTGLMAGVLFWWPVLGMMAVHLAFYGFERYRYPILPQIHGFGALAVCTLAGSGPTSVVDRLRAFKVALVVGLICGLSYWTMRPQVVHGLVSCEDGVRIASLWTTTDCCPSVEWSVLPDGPFQSCGTFQRRVHGNGFVPLGSEVGTGPRWFRVPAWPGCVDTEYRWKQDLTGLETGAFPRVEVGP